MWRLIFLIMLVGTIACDKKESIDPNVVTKIISGTKYGFCMGYCTHEFTMTKGQTIYRQSGPAFTTEVEPKTCEVALADQTWSDLTSLVDDQFFTLDSVYGCPDCVDQGAEFIEVVTSSRSHMITIDPSLDQEIHVLVEALRAERQRILNEEDCP